MISSSSLVLTPRQVEKLMISRGQKFTDTKGERQFAEYQQSRVMRLVQNVTLQFYDGVALRFFDFQCDFLKQRYPEMTFNPLYVGSYDTDFEIDGKGHKEKNDAWKDSLKVAAGLKVIHIPEPVTKEEHWGYLDKKISKALDSEEMVHHIAG